MASLRALECLVAVIEHGSVTEAAARLHLSQPALSHQLAALEREVRTPMIQRLPRGVRPTAAGRAAADDARLALAAAERAVTAARAVGAGMDGVLRIACAESMTAPFLAPVLRTWRRRRPRVRIELTEVTSVDAVPDGVGLDGVDVVLGPRPSAWAGPTDLVGSEEVVLAMPADDELAAEAVVAWTRLSGRPVVHYHPDNGLGGWLDALAARQGVVLEAAVRTRHATTAAQLAAAGLGVTLVPTSAVPTAFAGALRRLDPPLRRDVVVLRANRDDALAARFAADVVRRGVGVPAAVAARLERG